MILFCIAFKSYSQDTLQEVKVQIGRKSLQKTSVAEVKKAVAKVGHDAGEVKTTQIAYDNSS